VRLVDDAETGLGLREVINPFGLESAGVGSGGNAGPLGGNTKPRVKSANGEPLMATIDRFRSVSDCLRKRQLSVRLYMTPPGLEKGTRALGGESSCEANVLGGTRS